MKEIIFYKFHGAGNDFVIIDNRQSEIILNDKEIAHICDRRFGIGADGLILLDNSNVADLNIRYFNSDGFEASLCGNGSRCAAACFNMLTNCKSQIYAQAFDGLHKIDFIDKKGSVWNVKIQFNDINDFETFDDGIFIDTGSPHFVCRTSKSEIDRLFAENAEKLRHDKRFPAGTNVDFYYLENDEIFMRTFERGVEDETLSCGTGTVATALVCAIEHKSVSNCYHLHAKGGDFLVKFNSNESKTNFSDISLQGPAEIVFDGTIII